MKELMNGYSPIFDVAEKTANKYYRNNYQIFLASAIDAEDLVQEAYVTAIETIRLYPTKSYEEVFKICNQAISWRLSNLRRDTKKDNTTFSKERIRQNDETVTDYTPASANESTIYNFISATEYHSNRFNFEELIAVLSEKEYYFVTEIIKHRRTYADLAEVYGCSKQYVETVYKKALNKVRKYLHLDTKARMV